MAAKSNLLNMALCLFGICLVCSALLAGIYAVTAEPIEQAARKALVAAISKVLPEGGEISEAQTAELGGQKYEYYASTRDGQPLGWAVKTSTVGFGGPLTLLAGITPDGQVYAVEVLSHSETPGLGAKCTTDAHFMSQFRGFDTVARRLKLKKDGGDLDAITASTITSRAYTLAVSNAVDLVATLNNHTEEE